MCSLSANRPRMRALGIVEDRPLALLQDYGYSVKSLVGSHDDTEFHATPIIRGSV